MDNDIQKTLCTSAKSVIESVLEINFKTGTYTTVFTATTQKLPFGEQSWDMFAEHFAENYSTSGRKRELLQALNLESIKMALVTCGKYYVYGGKFRAESEGHKELVFTLCEKPDTAILSIIDFSSIADYYHNAIQHVKDEFEHDNITGAYNRDYYETNLKSLHINGGVAIIDIDDFKLCNDTYGHDVGDLALSETSRIIKENLSEKDVFIRYGGDEFLIILPDTSTDSLESILEKIRFEINSIRHKNFGNMRLSVSVGGVIANGEEALAEAVYRADRIMYLAKNHKNKVMTERRIAKIPKKAAEKNAEKQLVLIVDDAAFNRELLKEMLGSDYALAEASSGRECLELLDKYGTEISVVLLDIIMPEMDGFEVLLQMKKKGYLEDIPVIMITADDAEENLKKAFNMGVSDYIRRPFDASVVKRRIRNIALLYAKQRRMLSMLTEQIDSREKSNRIMIDILSNAVGCINSESIAHIQNLRKITMMLLERLNLKTDKYAFLWQDCRNIAVASSLHDIGKVLIDRAILNKPGKLTAKEYEAMKEHTVLGEKILRRGELASFQNEPLLKVAIQICRHHHERYDGKGYPDGLCGDDIPIAAQVVGIADAYDALVTERSYRKAYSSETALEMISRGDCGSFNPILIECLNDIKDKLTLEIYS